MELKAGDVFLQSGKGWVSNAIRFFTRKVGEGPTRATHVGLVIRDGSEATAVVMEALGRGVTRRLFAQGPGSGRYAVYRPPWSNEPDTIAVVVARAMEDDGKKYGFLGIGMSALDWFLNDAYVFRRLADTSREGQFCSWSVWDWCEAAFKNHGLTPFGSRNRGCSPDDIDDYVRKFWQPVKEF